MIATELWFSRLFCAGHEPCRYALGCTSRVQECLPSCQYLEIVLLRHTGQSDKLGTIRSQPDTRDGDV